MENKLAYETRYTLIDRILRIPGVFNNVDTLNSIFKTNKCNRVDLSRAGFYVAVTIAKHSVAIVCVIRNFLIEISSSHFYYQKISFINYRLDIENLKITLMLSY